MNPAKTSQRFPLPNRLETTLAVLFRYWDDLRRGSEVMPYWDDVDLTRLAAIRDHLLLFDVMDDRYRFSEAGTAVADGGDGSSLCDYFVDEATLPPSLAGLGEQCQATVGESAPTYTRTGSHARLLLPLWGNGQIQMLIGAVDQVDA